jgi:uncharacterized metal-binding protein YceD (DUF177 family)
MSKERHASIKVRISTLPSKGHTIANTLDLESLNQRMQECQTNDIEFTAAPSFEITLRKAPFGAEAYGHIEAQFTQSCSKCLDPRPRQIKLQCNAVIKERPQPDSVEDDISLIFSDNDYIDLSNHLEEMLILKIDPFWCPPLDDQAKCRDCGLATQEWSDDESTANSESRLGDLLNKAIKKNKS